MRILMASNHRYPSYRAVGSGHEPIEFPSGSGGHIQDLLARGLAELGHDVFYLLRRGSDVPLPNGIHLVTDPVADVDICQTTSVPQVHVQIREFATRCSLPWVVTCHLDRSESIEAPPAADNWIFVSRSLARTYGKDRYLLNGIDPADHLFSTRKQDFLLFMAPAERAIVKGLKTAIAVSRCTKLRLVVAGSGRSYDAINEIAAICRDGGAEYIGDIRGAAKAEWMAAAKALILPSATNEGCPLSLIEALMSGTPVVASAVGGIPEMIVPEIGFLCGDEDDYVNAIELLDEISPDRCRQYALKHFHYHRMVRDYLSEFEREISQYDIGERRSAACVGGDQLLGRDRQAAPATPHRGVTL
jgi:glycosyltransferase involved in cell wall biosynthesis